ncbi:MAG: ferrochelatase [Halieaceae bacterium]|jgi:ferrochelatase
MIWATEWLSPTTDYELPALGESGVESVDVVCPSFAVECLETVEKIHIENVEIFHSADGKNFRYIKYLNDADSHVLFYYHL